MTVLWLIETAAVAAAGATGHWLISRVEWRDPDRLSVRARERAVAATPDLTPWGRLNGLDRAGGDQ